MAVKVPAGRGRGKLKNGSDAQEQFPSVHPIEDQPESPHNTQAPHGGRKGFSQQIEKLGSEVNPERVDDEPVDQPMPGLMIKY